ncbi:hypothetical protein KQI65_05615 [bacterium]|nr:hypothetical protein [bacterium]
MIYQSELYRGDTLRMRRSFDSLLAAHHTDTTELFAMAREVATDRESVEELYRVTIERFERLSTTDSTAADSLRRVDSLRALGRDADLF